MIFIDEKSNLDGADRLRYYWDDPCNELEVFPKRGQGGRSVIVWRAISYNGVEDLVEIDITLNAKYYCDILQTWPLSNAERTLEENWTHRTTILWCILISILRNGYKLMAYM